MADTRSSTIFCATSRMLAVEVELTGPLATMPRTVSPVMPRKVWADGVIVSRSDRARINQVSNSLDVLRTRANASPCRLYTSVSSRATE